jgi:hypothetical protein
VIKTIAVLLLSMASASAHFVCVNGHLTVDAEYHRGIVFIGTVLSERYEPPTKVFDQEGTTYTVRVDERIRGKLPRTIHIFSENSSGRWPMDIGTKYLLFLYRDRGRNIVDYCGNSEIYRASSPTLREVRQLKAAEK